MKKMKRISAATALLLALGMLLSLAACGAQPQSGAVSDGQQPAPEPAVQEENTDKPEQEEPAAPETHSGEIRELAAPVLPAETVVYQLLGRAGTPEVKALLPLFK